MIKYDRMFEHKNEIGQLLQKCRKSLWSYTDVKCCSYSYHVY